jgi:hypothetical protein
MPKLTKLNSDNVSGCLKNKGIERVLGNTVLWMFFKECMELTHKVDVDFIAIR